MSAMVIFIKSLHTLAAPYKCAIELFGVHIEQYELVGLKDKRWADFLERKVEEMRVFQNTLKEARKEIEKLIKEDFDTAITTSQNVLLGRVQGPKITPRQKEAVESEHWDHERKNEQAKERADKAVANVFSSLERETEKLIDRLNTLRASSTPS